MQSTVALNRALAVWQLVRADTVRVELGILMSVGTQHVESVVRQLGDTGIRRYSWRRARITRFDLIVISRPDRRLAWLCGRVLLIGDAGWTPRDDAAVNLRPYGRLLPDFVGVAHPAQLAQLYGADPGLPGRVGVVGDPLVDWMSDNRVRRHRYLQALGVPDRCQLVTVILADRTGRLGSIAELVHRLVAQLPMDRYRIAVSYQDQPDDGRPVGRSDEIRDVLPDAIAAGVLVVDSVDIPAVVLASDLVIGAGDAFCPCGLLFGIPYLQAGVGPYERPPDSAAAALAGRVDQLDVRCDLREQVERALRRSVSGEVVAAAEQVFGAHGGSRSDLRRTIYELLRLDPLDSPVRITPLPDPASPARRVNTAYLVDADLHEAGAGGGVVRVERFPVIVKQYGYADGDHFQLVEDIEVDPSTRGNSEVFVRSARQSARKAMVWTTRILEAYPGAALAAAATATGCVFRWRDGRMFEAHVVVEADVPGVLAAAAGAYQWWVTGHEVRPEIALTVRLGAAEVDVTLRPMVSPVT